jgi:predicted alpha/beta-fold hydrolase
MMLLAVTRTGGHIGWYQGLKTPERWFVHPITEVFDYFSSK